MYVGTRLTATLFNGAVLLPGNIMVLLTYFLKMCVSVLPWEVSGPLKVELQTVVS